MNSSYRCKETNGARNQKGNRKDIADIGVLHLTLVLLQSAKGHEIYGEGNVICKASAWPLLPFSAVTSKWNLIEHRVFPHITRALQGVVLTTHQLTKELIEKKRQRPD